MSLVNSQLSIELFKALMECWLRFYLWLTINQDYNKMMSLNTKEICSVLTCVVCIIFATSRKKY